MSVANFSAFPIPTVTPYFYPSNLNSLQLNSISVPRAEPIYNDDEHFANSPYAGYYKQQQKQQGKLTLAGQQQQEEQNRGRKNGASENVSDVPSFDDASFNDYEDARNYENNAEGENYGEIRIETHIEESKSSSTSFEVPRDTQGSPSEIGGGGGYPLRPKGYAPVSSGGGGPDSKTSLHAIIDYDDDNEGLGDYYEDSMQVTPIEGPIFLRNGTVPVVPLNSYTQFNNGTLAQIPILWTALSIALELELRGDIVRGFPCIKKSNQLFCPTAGSSYPLEKIEHFIDQNKALVKRMYGTFQMHQEPALRRRRRRDAIDDAPDGGPKLGEIPDSDHPDTHQNGGDSYFSKLRKRRQDTNNFNINEETGRMDICESKLEILTPFWASNSAGKMRAVVNTQHFEQAIHQEVCSSPETSRCKKDCGCEQKYKWHRLLAFDPDNDCKGIFMDWFLFPSCCVCRCDKK